MATTKKNKTQPPATVQNFPIVGIGASAGGLEAFKRLLAAIPESSGMAYVLVQHLDPNHESILPEILQRVTKIPVHEITDDIHLAPDHIYIIPSNKILTSTDGVLQLSPREKKILNLSIDIFFTSLAEVHKEFAVGIVLSGTGSDGTLGLKAIKEHGGISMAQDFESAAYDSMPQSAVSAGVVDIILAPEKIPAQLLQIIRSYKTSHFFKAEEEELPKNDEDIFKQILLLLRQRSGVDFTYYKQPTFHRRIARRIAITKKNHLADYLKFLRTDKAEQDALFQDVLIPVTSFFRDPKTFQALTKTVFPALFKNKAADEPIRVWIAGCSTGEEAFSIAICLHEFLGEQLSNTKIQIFATDISEKAIRKARAAVYTKAEVEKVSETQLSTYFRKNKDGYELNKLIRDICVFAPHNFLKDPPFAKMDLISCRNVLIYMDTFLQKKAFTTFHYALKENGFLLLGKSESTGGLSDLFTQVEKNEKIYSRKPVAGRFMHVATERKEEFFVTKDRTATKQEGTQADFRKSAEAIMLSKSPASVVVNEVMDIVHIHGDITPFLQSPQGKPTYNLLKMAREGLAFELRNAIHKATKEKTAVTKENIHVKVTARLNEEIGKEKQSLVTIEIIPLTDTIESHYLIRFQEKSIPVLQGEKKASSGNKAETSRKLSGQNEQLEKELSQTREDMRSITEDMEAANEELQSANEELQSSNEEMQSLNEELETSKEELQSTNEELNIVNQELLDKQEQLNASHSEQVKASKLIEASEAFNRTILESSPDCLKVLDREGRIQYMNVSGICQMEIDDFSIVKNKYWWTLWGKENEEMVKASIDKAIKGETAHFTAVCPTAKGADKWWDVVVSPVYKPGEQVQQIISVARDITRQKEAEEQIRQKEEMFKSIFDNSLAAIVVTNDQGNYLSANKAASELLDYTVNDLLRMNVGALKTTAKDGATKRFEEYISKGEEAGEFDFITRNGAHKFVKYQAIRIKADFNLNIMMDITELKEAVQTIHESEEQFRTFADSIQNLAWIANAEGWIYWYNQRWYDYTGTTLEEMEGWGWQKVHHPNHVEKIIELTKQLWKKEEAFELTFPLRRQDGEYRWFLTRAYPVKDAKGNIERWIGTNTDINEQQKALNEKDDFISIASHEMKTPLTTAKGYLELLLRILSEENQTAVLYANKANQSLERLHGLVKELLDVSKIQNGKMDYNICTFNFNTMMDEAIENMQFTAKNHSLQITGNSLRQIKGDKDRIYQVLTNLLGNAVKYSPNGGKVFIKVEEQHGEILVSVQDFGIGMSSQHLDKIFDRYYRIQEHAVYFQGLGIGLYISNDIIERHKGKMWAESVQEKGSTFYFTLPL